jgi:hypothetical protein
MANSVVWTETASIANTQTYKYTGMSTKDCKMYTGCIVEVYLRGNLSHEETSVLFRNGEIVPMAQTRKYLLTLS